MTEAEERQKRAMILLEYTEGKKTLALLQKEAQDLGKELETVAKLLRERPESIDNPDGVLPTFQDLLELAGKIRNATADLSDKELRAREQGLL